MASAQARESARAQEWEQAPDSGSEQARAREPEQALEPVPELARESERVPESAWALAAG